MFPERGEKKGHTGNLFPEMREYLPKTGIVKNVHDNGSLYFGRNCHLWVIRLSLSVYRLINSNRFYILSK